MARRASATGGRLAWQSQNHFGRRSEARRSAAGKGPYKMKIGKMKIGSGFDVHAFGPGNFVMLAGVRVPHVNGVVAHSDGDVVLHALCDALLGAASLGDIGQYFSNDDPRLKGADSRLFVREVLEMLRQRELRVSNVDVTVLAEAPKLAPFRDMMLQTLRE